MSGESLLEPMDTDKASTSSGESNVNEEIIRKFCKEAAKSFFDEYGLISHQINSYNDFITCGIQNLFDSLGEVSVEPNYDPNKKGEGGWRYATITYGKVSLEAPIFWTSKGDGDEELRLMPRHARLQHMSYSSRMRVEVKVQVYTYESSKTDKYKTSSEHKIINKKILSDETKEIIVGRIPVMVKSKLCWLHELDKSDCLFDCGGYFVIKGAEKTFIAQEKLCLTRLWITSKPWTASYWPLTKKERVFVKLGDGLKMENIDEGKILNVFFLYASVPVWILFFALGVSSDKEIFQMIDIETCDADVVNILLATISSADTLCEGFRQGGKALQHIGEAIKKTKFPPSENVEECITKYLFPMIRGHKQKALFLGYMVKSLLLALSGKRKVDNKDDFRNKRLALAGDLLARELQGHIRHAERLMVRSMQKDLCGDRELQFIERYFDASIITNGLNRAFSTGVWLHPSKRTEKCTGVVATLRRTNPLQMLSDLRKTRQQVAYTGKVGDARYPNPSYWGKVCFLSTPDGENCGLVKNLAITGIVSSDFVNVGSSVTQFKVSSSKAGSSKIASSKSGLTTDSNSREAIIKKLVTFCGMELLESIPLDDLSKMDKVFLNGNWVGSCRNPSLFATNLRSIRRKRLINQQVEIKREEHQKEIRIFSDSGRIMRPLLIAENLSKITSLKGGSSFQSLLDEQIIEFIGTEEEEDCIIAWSPKDPFDDKGKSAKPYTHCELDLSFLLGLSCSIIPFANHNFARRVLFQSEKHSQQAIGYSTTNPHIRIDTLSHQMYYPQKPLFRSMVADCISSSEASSGKHTLPRPEIFNGQNAIVAVNVHQGYNQEDSLVMNKTSLERGMFRTEHFKNYKSEVDNKELQTSKHLKPKDMVSFGRMESRVGRIDSLDEDGFPFIGASLQTGDIIIGKVAESGVDNCVKLKHTEKGMVQKVVLSSNDEGKNFAAVTLRQVRSPCVGDKFSSMHGQKGVIGFLESQENFPFTIQGIVPDIVINPHAFPTRQTPGQLLEASLGKGICCGGLTKYSTPFTTPSFDVITDQLHRAGYSRWGGERVCNGRTGEMMRSLIFMGPTFYQRLHHMAEDKMKFRNTGPVHPLTRQPVSDRKRFGGVKFGEMERDCLLAHGAAANLHERLFTLSDFSHMHVCRSCRRAANVILRPLPGGKKIRGPYCQFCKSAENIVKVDVPYGAKLLYQELFSMGICLTFNTEIC